MINLTGRDLNELVRDLIVSNNNPIFICVRQAFSVVFQKAIAKADPSDDVDIRVKNLIECITYSVFQYTSRGLFECDKLIFASQMTFQVRSKFAQFCMDFKLYGANFRFC